MRTATTLLMQLLMSLMMFAVGSSVAFALPNEVVLAQGEHDGALKLLQGQYTIFMEERKALKNQFVFVEQSLSVLAQRIEVLKRLGGAKNSRRAELESLLRQGKELSNSIEMLQRKLQAVDTKLETLGARIVVRFDAKMNAIEHALVQGDAQTRKSLVKLLNTWSKQRAVYAQPLPKIDVKKVASMLHVSDKIEDPDDMLALADELQDAEVNVRKKLAWVQQRLKELKSRKRLLRSARSFARQRRFFEESDRARLVASRVRRSSGTAGAQASMSDGSDSEQNTEPSTNNADQSMGNGSKTRESFSQVPDARDVSTFSASDKSSEPMSDSTPVAAPETPVEAPEQTPDDVFGGGDEIIVERQYDPSTPARGAYFDDADLDMRIKKLESNQGLLKKQAERLKKRAKKLRRSAQALD